MKFYNLKDPIYIFGSTINHIIPYYSGFTENSTCNPVGGQIRFCSNSFNFSIRYTVSASPIGNFQNTGISTRSGITVLIKNNKAQWRIVDCVYAKESGELSFCKSKYDNLPAVLEIMICLPIFSNLSDIQVGIDDECMLEVIERKNMMKILVLGGVSSYGIGCTSSSMMFSNIIARKLNCIVYNISFNNNQHLEVITQHIDRIVDMYNEFDVILFEADYERQKPEIVQNSLNNILQKLSVYKCPIVMWNIEKDKIYKYVVDNKQKSLSPVFLMPIKEVFEKESDLCCFSKNFINDTANILLYKMFSKFFDKITKEC
ncbi:MAG: SGNH/GDSL hydrolase N-terminal domain-containing protein [Agathobacter sp.]